MTQVSKYPLPQDLTDRVFEIFLKTFVHIKNRDDADQFLSDLLTPTEKVMLSKRLAIAFLLQKGYDFRKIQRIMRVSAPTVASVNSALRYGSKGYKKLIEKIIKEESFGDLFEESIAKLLSIPAKAGKGGEVWRYLKRDVEEEVKKRKRRRTAL